jgi:hypothetical protein
VKENCLRILLQVACPERALHERREETDMRSLFVVALFAGASVAFAADEKPQAPSGQIPQNAAEQISPAEKERIRAEGAAGGTRPVPPEKRKAVGAGAGPHLHKTTPPPTKLPKDEPVEPPK